MIRYTHTYTSEPGFLTWPLTSSPDYPSPSPPAKKKQNKPSRDAQSLFGTSVSRELEAAVASVVPSTIAAVTD